jgi:hypothetical protein
LDIFQNIVKYRMVFGGTNMKPFVTLFILIFLFGLFLRLQSASEYLYFTHEEAQYFEAVKSDSGYVSGPYISKPSWIDSQEDIVSMRQQGMVHGFIMHLALKVYSLDITTLVKLAAIVDTLTILVIFWAVLPLGRRASLIAALIYAVGPWPVFFSRWPYGLVLIPLFAVVSVGSFIRLRGGNEKFWPFLIFFSALVAAIHPVGFFWIAIIVLSAIVFRLKTPKSHSARLISFLMVTVAIGLIGLYEKDTIAFFASGGSLASLVYGAWNILMFLPQDLLIFLYFSVFGNILFISLLPLSFLAGVFVICAAYIKSDMPIRMHMLRQYAAWFTSIIISTLLAAHWFYGASVWHFYSGPALLIGYVGLCFLWAIGSVLAEKRGLWEKVFWFVIFVTVLLSANASIQNMGRGARGNLSFAQTNEALKAIAQDDQGAGYVCVKRDTPNTEDLNYLSKRLGLTRNMSFTSTCLTDCPSGLRCYTFVVRPAIDEEGTPIFEGDHIRVLRK